MPHHRRDRRRYFLSGTGRRGQAVRLALALSGLLALTACNPIETAADVAIGTGQVVLGTADLLI